MCVFACVRAYVEEFTHSWKRNVKQVEQDIPMIRYRLTTHCERRVVIVSD